MLSLIGMSHSLSAMPMTNNVNHINHIDHHINHIVTFDQDLMRACYE